MATTTKATTKTTKTAATKAKSTKTTKAPAAGKTLIIAEKPSVASDLVKVLGAKTYTKNNGLLRKTTRPS
jgi:hypothetical protein